MQLPSALFKRKLEKYKKYPLQKIFEIFVFSYIAKRNFVTLILSFPYISGKNFLSSKNKKIHSEKTYISGNATF